MRRRTNKGILTAKQVDSMCDQYTDIEAITFYAEEIIASDADPHSQSQATFILKHCKRLSNRLTTINNIHVKSCMKAGCLTMDEVYSLLRDGSISEREMKEYVAKFKK